MSRGRYVCQPPLAFLFADRIQKGTTVTIENLFAPLPVRRKELERNIKREFGKALSLLHAYALGPCASNAGVRLSVANFSEKGYGYALVLLSILLIVRL